MSDKEQGFDHWAILELMGHRRLAGKVTEAQVGGATMLRIDIPGKDGWKTTQFYSPSAVYCITPTSEAIAREVAEMSGAAPVHAWELNRRSLPASSTDDLDGDDGLDD